MKYLLIILSLMTLTGCEKGPRWTDPMKECLKEPEIDLLDLALTRFEKVLDEFMPEKTRTEQYKQFISDVERKDLMPKYYHHLLIKETTKKMLLTDFYENMWQESSQWTLNDRKGTAVYLINGFGGVPSCLAKGTKSAWFSQKLESYKKPVSPIPSLLAKELLNNLTTEDYEQPQIRAFIALSLCYTQGVAYYRK